MKTPQLLCFVSIAALGVLLEGCKDMFGSACTLNIQPGVVVEIRNATTGVPIADSARGFVIDGSYSDSLTPYGFIGTGLLLSRQAAGERAGTYTVIVSRPGYADWSTSNVRVTDGTCHVNTVALQAALTPTP